MIAKVELNHRIIRAKDFFAKQYGIEELERIESATINSFETMKLIVSLENKFFPTADQIIKTAAQVNYLKEKANIFGVSPSGIEKKVDYIHISSILLLKHWLKNILPNQEPNPVTRQPLGNDETAWIFATEVLRNIFKKCDELENQFKI